jgi:glycosyltransferase involved in cell wall biosynthesis
VKSFNPSKDKVLIISNMYPSKKDPIYGNFVEEQNIFLNKSGIKTLVSSIKERDGSVFFKIYKYSKLYTDSFIKALKPSVKIVHFHYEYPTALFAPFFKNILGKRIFITIHGSSLLSHKGWKKKLVRTFLTSSDFVVCVSDYLKKEVQNYYQLEPSKVLSIHCGVDTEKFVQKNKEEMREKLSLPVDKKIIIYLGRLHNEKGIDTLISSIPDLLIEDPSYYFLFVGNGPEKSKTLKLAIDNDQSVRSINGVPKELVPDYFNAADLFIFPTKKETFGLVAIEALSCGTPVVASNVGGVPEIIEDSETGLLFEHSNPTSLIKTINKFFKLEGNEIERMKKNGIIYCQNNDIEKQTKKIIEFYLK